MPIVAVLTRFALRATVALWGSGWGAPAPTPPAPAAPPETVSAPSPIRPAAHLPAPPPAAAPLPPADGLRTLRPIGLVSTREPTVAITFDACATKSHWYTFDRNVFDILKREQVPATIFVSGRWVEAHPDVMTELAGDPLVEFGDHSYDHPHMAHLPDARIVEEIDQTEAALARYGKHSVAFRPPFGEWSHHLITVVQDLRLPTVTWDVVSGDPSAHTTTDRMIHNVVDKARAGSIIIFHINGRGLKTAEALPTILHELRERGFRFVLLSDLMAGGRPAPIPTAPLPLVPAATERTAAPIPAAIMTPSSSTMPGAGPQ
jgi:peptidoglycan/xylan/chitin deacetylase (PgdA/CDA1 family)